MLNTFEVNKVLIIAPLRVARDTWPAEIEKWDHLKNLDISIVVGDVKTRIAAVHHPAMIYVVNRENVKWLVEYYEKNGMRWDFSMVVIDELSSFKNYQSQRFKFLRKVRPYVKRWVGLTGTPSSNGLMDLWAEIGILDGGERLGKFIGRYREAYFKAASMNPSSGVVFQYKPKEGAEDLIYQRISDITISMKALDYLNMPDCIPTRYEVEMNAEERKLYDMLRQDLLIPFNAQSGGPSEEIARLAGSRFVNISEPEKKITLDAALTKRLTGNDTITARYLHENSFEFRPNFKIFINTNHRPNITDLTLFKSGRIKIIPFDRHFDEKEQDKGLKGFFAEPENMSGILNWMLEGYKMFRSQGLEMPDSVVQATMDYQMFSDKMGQFFSECLQPKADSELRRAAVYTRYKEWCAENGYRADSAKVLNAEIDKRYTVQKKRPADGVGSATQIVLGVEFCLSETTKGDFNVVPE